jgi:hypothetical protein
MSAEENEDTLEGTAAAADVPSQPEVEKIRSRININKGRVRSKTIAGKRLTREERRLASLIVYPDDEDQPAEPGRVPGHAPAVPVRQLRPPPVPGHQPRQRRHQLNIPAPGGVGDERRPARWTWPTGAASPWKRGEILNLTRERIRQVECGGWEDERAEPTPRSSRAGA